MVLVGSWSAAGRRTFFTLSLAAAVLAAVPSSVAAQAAGQQAAAPAQQDPFNFSSNDAGLIVWTVPEAQVADFEAVWGTILAKLNASDKPELKELGGTLSVMRPAAPPAGQPVQYFIVADPSTKTSVNPTDLLYKSGLFTPEEAKAMFEKLPTSQISALPLKKVQPGAATAPAATAPAATTPPATTTPPTP